GAPDPQEIAQQHITIETKWAVIVDTGTKFLIYYNPNTEVTWVVVVDGSVTVSAGGQTIRVPAQWQTWVEPNNKPPEPPIPATRIVAGSRFPTVDSLTNSQLQDANVLINQQCTVNTQSNDPLLNLRTEPDPGSDQNIIDRMLFGTRFEGLG